ncbi:MAG: beta-class carbonic anhydrase [Mycoplasmatales bacterium]
MKEKMLNYNKVFVENEMYKNFQTSKFPDKKALIVTCMDSRLTELLPAALGIGNGEVKMVKNAGGLITNRYGSVMRSIVVGIYSFDIEEVFVIGHTDCGMHYFDQAELYEKIIAKGISKEKFNQLEEDGLDILNWIQGFSNSKKNINQSVSVIKSHPLIPNDIKVFGFVIDSNTGELKEIKD